MTTYRTLMALVVLVASPAFAQSQRRDNPTAKDTLRWMQTSLESGSGDYWVGHETRSVRLEDFAGCKVHFSASTHQQPFANGEPAPDKKPTRIDYFFELGDIDPANITFSKGQDSGTEVPSFITIRTRNDEKKITSRYSWEPEVGAKADDTFVIFAVEAFGSDNDYVVRFATAFKHAVEACGGKPSLFADSDRRDERVHTAPDGVAVQSAPLRKDIPSIARAANGAIVSIVMSDKNGKAIAQGSGFIVSKDGMIITNYHVIAEGSSAVVKLPDGAVYLVDGVLASDKARDVAVIKAHGENFRTLTLGDSDRVQVGEEVVAIGNPLSLESTVSNGIVSAIRTVEDKGGKFVQITAPISPGSSGGPLFNMAGEVVGITSAGIKGGENLNFAIPINDVKPMISSVSEARRDGVSALPDEPEDDKTAVGQTNPAVATPATNNPPSLDDTVKFLNDVVQPDAASSVVADPNCEIEMLNNALPTLMLPSGGVHVSRVDASGIKHYELNYSKLKFATPRYSVIFLSTIDPTSIKSYPAFSEELIARERPGDENPDGLKHPDLTVVRFDTRNKELTILQGTRQESEGGMFITDKTASAELVVFQSKDRAERFVTAFVHAVNLCGGKPSDFAPTPRE